MSSSFLLCLKISSGRWKGERDELLPLLLRSKKQRRSYSAEEEEEEKACRKEKKAKKAGQGGVLQVPSPRLECLFLDLNEEPNPLWEEMKAGKPTVVFNRRLTPSDVRRDLTRCILNRREMKGVFVPTLTEEETEQVYDKEKKLPVLVVAEGQGQKKTYEMKVVWWRALKQFALVHGWTEFVHDHGLLKDDLIQFSYFRFGGHHDRQPQQHLGLLIRCRPELPMPPVPQPQPQPQPHPEQIKKRRRSRSR